MDRHTTEGREDRRSEGVMARWMDSHTINRYTYGQIQTDRRWIDIFIKDGWTHMPRDGEGGGQAR